MATPGFLSKRVKKKSQTGLTTDRYEFLGLDQAEPDLGDPLVGLSSVGANPPPISGNQYVLTAYENQTGRRYWTAAAQITGSGLIPGSFTVFDNNVQVGAANSFNKFNFVGNGVSVDPVGAALTQQTGIATIRITVSDVVAPGNLNSIPYKASNGFLAGATDFVYSSGNIGIGTTIPTTKLDIVGNVRVSGISTLGITTITNLTTQQLYVSGITTVGFITANNVYVGVATVGFITASNLYVSGITTVGFITATNLYVSGVSTFTNGPILVGTTTSTGTASQRLQVTGGAYVSGNVGIGTTNPIGQLQVSSGPVIIGTAISTGTASQNLQVSGGAYFSTQLGVGVTNPASNTQVAIAGTLGISEVGGSGARTLLSSSGSGFILNHNDNSNINFNSQGTNKLAYRISDNNWAIPSGAGLLVGTGATTGTANQLLRVEGGAYVSGSVGIGTTNPTSKLQVDGNVLVSGVSTFIGDGTAENPAIFARRTITQDQGIKLYGTSSGNFVYNESTGSNPKPLIIDSSQSANILFKIAGSTKATIQPTGELLVGTTTATGTASQRLQVSGGAYVSGNLGIGTTNPLTPLQVETYGVKTGVGTFTASVGVSTTLDSFSVSSTDFKIAEYTVHIGFGSYIQAQKVLVTQDQSTAYAQEYGVVYNNSLLVSIGATISGENCILQATPQTGVSGLTTYRFARNTLL